MIYRQCITFSGCWQENVPTLDLVLCSRITRGLTVGKATSDVSYHINPFKIAANPTKKMMSLRHRVTYQPILTIDRGQGTDWSQVICIHTNLVAITHTASVVATEGHIPACTLLNFFLPRLHIFLCCTFSCSRDCILPIAHIQNKAKGVFFFK